MAAVGHDDDDDDDGEAMMMMIAKEVPETWLLLSVPAACCPQPRSSRPDFSQRSIYYLADLLKVISEPSGPAR